MFEGPSPQYAPAASLIRPLHHTPHSLPRLYAFDVHCNSYFPLFLLLYGRFSFKHIFEIKAVMVNVPTSEQGQSL